MKIYSGFSDPNLKPAARVIAVGVFDGVHKGHQKILDRTIRIARLKKARPTVVTFDPHPDCVLRGAGTRFLMSLAHRLRLLKRHGVQETIVIRFDRTFSRMRADVFLSKLKTLGMKAIVVGSDFRFGAHGEGDSIFLKDRAEKIRFEAHLVEAAKSGRSVISSTRIRKLIAGGFLKKAGVMLGRPVCIYGDVVRGHGRGTRLGFPTANVNPHHEALPPPGVYAARGYLGRHPLSGVIHLGKKPTFKDNEPTVEVHFFHFHKNIYGKELELAFLKKIRGTKRFESPSALTLAIRRDIGKARQILTSWRIC